MRRILLATRPSDHPKDLALSQAADPGTVELTPSHRPVAPKRALDMLNFVLVDVHGAVRPYLNVYLYTHRHWADGTIGLVSTISGLFGIAIQTPAGAAIDAIRDKRLPLLLALVVLSIGPVLIGVSPHFWPVLVGSMLLSSVGGLLNPSVAALTVGVTRKAKLTRRMGRNAAYERAGNVAIALGIGGIGFFFPDRAVFLLVPALCVLAAAALFSIQREAQDEKRLKPADEAGASAWTVLAGSRPLVVFAVCEGIFHFANGPLLTLVAQEVSSGHKEWSSTVVSVCIIGAQAVMVPMALVVGRRADRWGRKPLLIAAFIALPIRAVLYALWQDPFWLIGVQLLDGVGAGLLSAAKPLVVADLMEKTGHYNLALGIVGTLQAIGASLSFIFAGLIVQHAGFDAAYLFCGGAALLALMLLVTQMPETRTCPLERSDEA